MCAAELAMNKLKDICVTISCWRLNSFAPQFICPMLQWDYWGILGRYLNQEDGVPRIVLMPFEEEEANEKLGKSCTAESRWLTYLSAGYVPLLDCFTKSYKEDPNIGGRNKTVPTAILLVQSHISSKRMKAEIEQKHLSWSLTVGWWQGWIRLLTGGSDPCLWMFSKVSTFNCCC